MDLAEFYPAPGDLVKSEREVLNFLRGNTYINEHHPQVARDAARCDDRLSHSNFEFNSHFDIWSPAVHRGWISGRMEREAVPNVRLTISGLIETGKETIRNVTYCFSVCRIRRWRHSERLTILRKFHFDVTAGCGAGAARPARHPQSHLQYCGEMIPYMASLGCREAQLSEMHPWLSEPRVLYWPMSLALLIDMALHEFPDQASAKFRADSYWRCLVRRQEDLLLRPFCEKCVEVIVDGRDADRTLADAFYVG